MAAILNRDGAVMYHPFWHRALSSWMTVPPDGWFDAFKRHVPRSCEAESSGRGCEDHRPGMVSPLSSISLNVVVFNEEARLEECLSDARDHVDEIVVVDQMSTDGTPAIAQRLADVYVRDVHHGHAEPSRELATARSSGDWFLILDADERMSDLLKRELRGWSTGRRRILDPEGESGRRHRAGQDPALSPGPEEPGAVRPSPSRRCDRSVGQRRALRANRHRSREVARGADLR